MYTNWFRTGNWKSYILECSVKNIVVKYIVVIPIVLNILEKKLDQGCIHGQMQDV